MAREVSAVWGVVQAWLDELDFPPTQSRLGERLGVARSAVSDWKYGKTTPTPEHLRGLADLMEPTWGPTAHDDLLTALNIDQGYLDPAVVVAIAARRNPKRPRRGRQQQQPD